MAELSAFDIGILSLLAVSILIGIYRGFLRETLTLVTWLIASTIAYMYGAEAAKLFTFVDTEIMRKLLGMASVFTLVVLVGFLIKFFICKAFSIAGPSPLDRFLGALFGFFRAALIILLVMLFSPEALLQQPWYKNSKFIPKLKVLSDAVKNNTPQEWKENLKKEIEEYTINKATSAGVPPETAAAAAAVIESQVAPESKDGGEPPATPPATPTTTTPKPTSPQSQ